MFANFAIVCFIGACFRMIFYRLVGHRHITMKYLQGKEDEQQMTSLIIGFLVLFLISFVVSRIL